MVLFIILREQMAISASKYLLATVITLGKRRKYSIYKRSLDSLACPDKVREKCKNSFIKFKIN